MKLRHLVLAGTLLLTGPALTSTLAEPSPAGASPGGAPARPAFTVTLPAAAPPTGLHLSLVNVLGRGVYERALPAAAPVTVPAGTVPAGLYWVRLRGPQGYQLTQRLVLSQVPARSFSTAFAS